jgi:hypothetical protein
VQEEVTSDTIPEFHPIAIDISMQKLIVKDKEVDGMHYLPSGEPQDILCWFLAKDTVIEFLKVLCELLIWCSAAIT